MEVDQSTNEIPTYMTLTKFKEDFGQVLEEIENVEYDRKSIKTLQ